MARQFDQTSDGSNLELLNVIDEFARGCSAIEVERNIDADGVVPCLDKIAALRGAPKYLRAPTDPSSDLCRLRLPKNGRPEALRTGVVVAAGGSHRAEDSETHPSEFAEAWNTNYNSQGG
jgi:hypothetical protein